MAQTKRKRQTKHRGNAAGVIESRGRTGRPPSAEEKKHQNKTDAREARLNRRPTWKSAFTRAALLGPILFVFIMLTAHPKNHASPLPLALFLGVFAVVIYTPAGFYLEMFLWRRRMAKKQKQQRS